MMTENQKAWAKTLREEKKRLEAILHPSPVIGDIQILHEHLRNGKIRFSAWRGNNPIQPDKFLMLSRNDVLRLPKEDFNRLYQSDFEWLIRN